MMSSPILEVSHLTVCYEKKPAIWEADLKLPSGSMAGVVGPNGAGKSTFLKAILGLIPHTSGSVQFFGQSYKKVKSRVAYVPQRESVDWDYPISAREVVLMGLYKQIGVCRWIKKEHRLLAEAALERVDMLTFADRQIGELSGGQQQRVFLARALVQQADLYVMDEPFAGIDATTEKVILELMQDLKKKGSTVLCVHHDLATVADYFDHLTLLNLSVIASGETCDVFTKGKLTKCYGGRLEMLTKLTDSLARLEALKH